jgi:C_GCAxxG_C_C family probable redox protein
MSKVEDAVKCFKQGFNCAQALFSTYADPALLGRGDALKIACGLGAGFGRMGETCGAVTGAILAIGSWFGMNDPANLAAKEKTYALVRQLVAEFTQKHGTVICRHLIDCDLNSGEGLQRYRDAGLMDKLCVNFVADAAGIVERLIHSPQD